MIVLITILVKILENEVVVSVRVFLESNQTLIRHINISFTSISHSHQYLIHINISFTHIAERGSVRDRAMVFNATFNNISVISWRAVLLVKKTLIIL